MPNPVRTAAGSAAFSSHATGLISALLAIGEERGVAVPVPEFQMGQRSIGSAHGGCTRSRACAHWYRGPVRSPRQRLA